MKNSLWLKLHLCLLIILVSPCSQLLAQPAELEDINLSPKQDKSSNNFELIPVGINLNKRNIIPSTFIRGAEDGEKTINFEQWLIPLSEITKALNIQVNSLQDGQLELKSAGFLIRIKAEDLITDTQLGLVISVEQIQTLLGIPTTFDFSTYAINLNPPWLNLTQAGKSNTPLPIIIEGLPLVEAPQFSLTTISSNIGYSKLNSISNSNEQFQGQIGLVGSLLGGSWYLGVNQPELSTNIIGRVGEAQYLKQTPQADYVLGSHSTFWNGNNLGQYWGFTTIQRFGYSPQFQDNFGGFNPRQRLQSDAVLQDIIGDAAPGTLVQLTKGFKNEILAEVLVDESGQYRFDNIPTQNRQGNKYRLLLYPKGLLATNPEIREVEFLDLPGQLSKGTSALILSTGWSRNFNNDDFFGDLTNWRAAIAYRMGLSDELTVGIGAIQEESTNLIGEIFYQPKGIPLKIGISGLATAVIGELDYAINFQYKPSEKFNLILQSDPLSQSFELNLGILPGFTLRARGDNFDNTIAIGANVSQKIGNFFFFGSGEYEINNEWNLNLRSRFYNWEFNYQQDHELTEVELAYYFSRSFTKGYALWLNYQRRNNLNNNDNDGLAFGGRYISDARSLDGRDLWSLNFGYRMGTEGNGLVTAATTAIIPGLDVRIIYEQVSLFSNDNRFAIQLLPAINIQPQIGNGEQRFERLRTQGGIFIQPFIDNNENGLLDNNETVYLEDLEALLILNNQSLKRYPKNIVDRGVYIRLPSGNYRLDLDLAGYPFDTTPKDPALAIEVIAGSYTTVQIPFSPSYTIMGVVSDNQGKPITGARVEAINQNNKKIIFSVTNEAGIYFLEGLKKGEYEIIINSKFTESLHFSIKENSEKLLELNLTK